jgi:porphobilinogen deaminase
MVKKYKIGSRGSNLALTQTNFVAEKLKKVMPEADVEICIIKTRAIFCRMCRG